MALLVTMIGLGVVVAAPTAATAGAPLELVGRAMKPSAGEVARNPRARSAVMRVAWRTSHALPADWPQGYVEAAA